MLCHALHGDRLRGGLIAVTEQLQLSCPWMLREEGMEAELEGHWKAQPLVKRRQGSRERLNLQELWLATRRRPLRRSYAAALGRSQATTRSSQGQVLLAFPITYVHAYLPPLSANFPTSRKDIGSRISSQAFMSRSCRVNDGCVRCPLDATAKDTRRTRSR
ncbi:hypothetical protein LZ30DRAFT_45540 [Colletotrichum cereale]|nr:hypothetical protein LZ30DRAFT_45540 [Colletotrichum cereale]